MEHYTAESWEPRGVEEAGCKIYGQQDYGIGEGEGDRQIL